VYDRQVAQDVRATQGGLRLDGDFRIEVTPKRGVSPATIDALVREEVRRVVDSGVTEREVTRGKNVHRSRSLNHLQSAVDRANLLNYYNWFVGTPDFIAQDAARYDRLSAADLHRVARSYLGGHKVVLTVVPEGHPELQVRPIAQ
jgi:zinc protease